MYQIGRDRLEGHAGIRRISIGWKDHSWIVDTVHCDEVADAISKVLRGWSVEELPPTADVRPGMSFSRAGESYDWKVDDGRVTAGSVFGKPGSLASAVADFHFMFNGWFVDQFESCFTLHCAAVELGDGVVLFPGQHRAGKSLLSVALAAHDHKLFGDDIVAIDGTSCQAISLGTLPRMRLPLPPQAAGPDLRRFIAAHPVLGDDEQQYVGLDCTQLAEVGAVRPIKAIVHLRRLNRKQPATLSASTAGSALRSLIQHNYSKNMPASTLFDHLHSVVQGASCHCLTYYQVEDAVSLLEQTFTSA